MNEIISRILSGDLEYVKDNLNGLYYVDHKGRSYLFYATVSNNVNIFNYLLEKKIPIDLKDYFGNTILHEACERGNTLFVKILLQNKANLSIMNLKRELPIHLASKIGNYDIVKELCDYGSPTDVLDSDNRLPLHYACLSGNIQLMNYFLDVLKGDINQKDSSGNSLLHYTCRTSNVELNKNLLERNINVNILNDRFETPLFNAVIYSSLEVVSLLIDYDALVDIVNKRSETAIDYAVFYKRKDIHNFLTEYKKSPRYDKLATKLNIILIVLNREIFELQKQVYNQAYLDAEDRYGNTAIDYAKQYNLTNCLSLLKGNIK
jgi:ankyrin repeat protein